MGYASIAEDRGAEPHAKETGHEERYTIRRIDVHADTIAVAVAEAGREGEVRNLGIIRNDPVAVRKLVEKVGKKGLRVCYEAGPTGYALYWQLTELGVECEVIAPTLVPRKAGERIKTDRRDAIKLARCYRAGELTPIWVPDKAHEALRDLVRAREAAKQDQHRARQRLSKFLLRSGRKPPQPKSTWTQKYLAWIRTLQFEHGAQQATLVDYLGEVDHLSQRIERLEKSIDEAIAQAPDGLRAVVEGLQCLRGVARLTATTIAIEIGSFSRFQTAKQLMAYCGVVPSEHSSGGTRRQGAITKTGNAHVRRVLFESAWAYRHRPNLGRTLKKRQERSSSSVVGIALKAQHRLHRRYIALAGRGKPMTKIIGAVGRELLGFIWAIAVDVESHQKHQQQENRQKKAA